LRQALDRPESKQLYRGVHFVNALIEQKRFSLVQLAERITRLMPPQVRLAGLALGEAGEEPVVRFSIVVIMKRRWRSS